MLQNVPTLLRGVWERRWIEHADGTRDDTSTVVWMQFEHEMADVRFTADLADIARRGSLDGCDLPDLLRLAESDSSSGHTTCTELNVGNDGARTATAEWFSDPGIALQPQTLYPEAGLLEWSSDGTVMIERAPSGAYVEEWHLVPGTEIASDPVRRRATSPGTELFVIGPVAIEVIDRRPNLAPFAQEVPGSFLKPDSFLASGSFSESTGRLVDDIAALSDDLVAARTLLDCEFSLAREQHGVYVITGSTHPWRIGATLDMENR